MTQVEMEDIIHFYLRGADSKSIVEYTEINVDRNEIEKFLDLAAGFIDTGIKTGCFDE